MVVTPVKALCESGGQSTVDGGLHLGLKVFEPKCECKAIGVCKSRPHLGKYKTGCILVRPHFDKCLSVSKCMCKWRKSVSVIV